MVSRTQVAAELAKRLGSDRRKAVRQTAAWLVATGRARQARYLARDVAGTLADDGYVLAQVTTARPLHDPARKELAGFIKNRTGAREVELDTSVDASMIGGVRVVTPSATLDATVRTKLASYVEGVMGD